MVFYQARDIKVGSIVIGAVAAVDSVLTLVDVWGDAIDSIIPSLLLIAGVWMIVRVARTGVAVNKDGLVIVNPLRTRGVPWSDVKAFEQGRGNGFGLWPKVGIRKVNGDVVPIYGLGLSFRGPTRSVERAIQRLQEHLGGVERC